MTPRRTTRRRFLALGGATAAVPWIATRRGKADIERKLHVDGGTGVQVWQITSFPTVHQNLYFHSRCWTADAQTFVFQALREPVRGAPYDLYRANVDGTELEPVISGRRWGNFALHPSRRAGYFNDGNELSFIDMDTREVELLAVVEAEGGVVGGPGSMTDDGRLYCFGWRAADGSNGFGLLDTVTRLAGVIPLGVRGKFTHLQIEPREGRLVHFVSDPDAEGRILYVADREGKVAPLPLLEANGHNAWLGPTGKVYTNTLGLTRDILAARPGSAAVEVIAKAPPRFWHTGVSPDGEWMVSDTHNPDEGLHLICVRTGRHCLLCRAESSQGHSQYTHPHPSVSPEGRYVLFNSDRTGVPHVYVAHIPDEMKRSLSE